jgi:hypothetical protein
VEEEVEEGVGGDGIECGVLGETFKFIVRDGNRLSGHRRV